MIRPLRIRHRRIFTVLGLLLPIAFGFGIAARKPVPQMNTVPAGFNVASQQFAAIIWERSDLFTNAPVQVRLLGENGRFAVACTATADFAKPDLLVYWSSGDSRITDALPDNAVLLGAFTSSTLPITTDIASRDGLLVLFSLADQEIIAVSQRIRFNDLTK